MPVSVGQRPETWRSVVTGLRTIAEGERWRLCALEDVPTWPVFCAYWQSVMGRSVSLVQNVVVSVPLPDFPSRLLWTWNHANIYTEAAVEIIACSCTQVSQGEVLDAFESLRQSGLIFADGSVCKFVTDRMERMEALRDTQMLASINAAALVSRRAAKGLEKFKDVQP